MQIAILDDYQNVALQLADLVGCSASCPDYGFQNDHVADPSAVVDRLRPFGVVCVMRERTPLSRNILQQLPTLKLIASTGAVNASIDTRAAAEFGIAVTATGYDSTPTIELAWSLIMASMSRHRPGGHLAQSWRMADRHWLELARQDPGRDRVGKHRQ